MIVIFFSFMRRISSPSTSLGKVSAISNTLMGADAVNDDAVLLLFEVDPGGARQIWTSATGSPMNILPAIAMTRIHPRTAQEQQGLTTPPQTRRGTRP